MCTGPFSIDHSLLIRPTSSSPTGTQFSLACMDGFSATAQTGTMVCGKDNIWKNRLQCQANICTGPFSIEHSVSVTPSTSSPSGTQFTLSCLDGFSASAQSGTLICGDDNVWRNQPRCQGINCPHILYRVKSGTCLYACLLYDNFKTII